jgi:hypothetical protein
MATHVTMYRGVVRDNTVIFDEPVRLPDGMEVEVRPLVPEMPPPGTATETERGQAFRRYLLETGLLSHVPTGEPDPPGLDRTPIEIVDGPPLSQTIIEERR